MLKASDETMNPDEMLGEHCQRMGLWQVSIMDLGAAICSVQARWAVRRDPEKSEDLWNIWGRLEELRETKKHTQYIYIIYIYILYTQYISFIQFLHIYIYTYI